ncbi:hypothetical protein AOLI_G00013760 [Acnodon oligacanthus]
MDNTARLYREDSMGRIDGEVDMARLEAGMGRPVDSVASRRCKVAAINLSSLRLPGMCTKQSNRYREPLSSSRSESTLI